jgi:hypothetical protein
MPMTVNVGFSQKLGQPDYGSMGASCHVECELDCGLLDHDPNLFQSKIRELYAACAQAVHDELGRHQPDQPHSSPAPANGKKKATTESKSPGVPATQNGSSNHQASARQIEYLERLARENAAMGSRRLEALSQRMHRKPIARLSSFEASGLIDTLKATKEGRLDLKAALEGGDR